jgi:hypothetical protein
LHIKVTNGVATQAPGSRLRAGVSTGARRSQPRPFGFSPDKIWPVLLADIAEGASLTAALQRLRPSPSYWWAKDQLRRNPELRARYAEACEDRADRLAEQLLELADTPIPEGLDGPGKSAWVQQLRLKVDARKWIACKLKPRQYGDRIDLEVRHTSISITAALAEAERRVIEARTAEQSAPLEIRAE